MVILLTFILPPQVDCLIASESNYKCPNSDHCYSHHVPPPWVKKSFLLEEMGPHNWWFCPHGESFVHHGKHTFPVKNFAYWRQNSVTNVIFHRSVALLCPSSPFFFFILPLSRWKSALRQQLLAGQFPNDTKGPQGRALSENCNDNDPWKLKAYGYFRGRHQDKTVRTDP